jgi:hypothetical protein
MKGPAEGRDMAAVDSEGLSWGWRGRVAVNWGSEVDGGSCVVTSARKAVEANWVPPRRFGQAELSSFPIVPARQQRLLCSCDTHDIAFLHLYPECRTVPRRDTSPYCTGRPAFDTPACSLRPPVNGAAQSLAIVSLECCGASAH